LLAVLAALLLLLLGAGPRTRMFGMVMLSVGDEVAVVASSKIVVGVSGGREAAASWYWRLLRLEELRSVAVALEPRVEGESCLGRAWCASLGTDLSPAFAEEVAQVPAGLHGGSE
jgi:hypothetical protein